MENVVWLIQIFTNKWENVCPADSETPYVYPTEEQANKTLRLCYPDHLHLTRTIKIETDLSLWSW